MPLQEKEYFAGPYPFVPILDKPSVHIFEFPIHSASVLYAPFSSARIVPG